MHTRWVQAARETLLWRGVRLTGQPPRTCMKRFLQPLIPGVALAVLAGAIVGGCKPAQPPGGAAGKGGGGGGMAFQVVAVEARRQRIVERGRSQL